MEGFIVSNIHVFGAGSFAIKDSSSEDVFFRNRKLFYNCFTKSLKKKKPHLPKWG
jgi:hypothetical protein